MINVYMFCRGYFHEQTQIYICIIVSLKNQQKKQLLVEDKRTSLTRFRIVHRWAQCIA